MPSTATVTQRPLARRAAAFPAAKSICDISQPPKMSPAGLVSDGIAIVRMTAARFSISSAVMPHPSRSWPDFECATIDHFRGDVENDGEAEVGDPMVALEQAGDEARSDPHQRDRQPETEDENDRVFAGGAGHRQHVVEGHGYVRHDDLPRGLT